MRKYLTIAKQVAKEKIGKADTVNSEQVESEREHFVVLKDGYNKIYSSGKTLFMENCPSFSTQNESFISVLLGFSGALKDSSLSSTNTQIITETIQLVGDGLQKQNKIGSYYVESVKSGFLETTRKVNEEHIKEVTELRNKQEIARLQLSHTVGQLKGIQKKAVGAAPKDAVSVATKLQLAENATKLAQEEYDVTTGLFVDGMERLEKATTNEFISSLTALAEAQLRSMEDGVAMWKDVLAGVAKLHLENGSPIPSPTMATRLISSSSRTPTHSSTSSPTHSPSRSPTHDYSASPSPLPFEPLMLDDQLSSTKQTRSEVNKIGSPRRNSSPAVPAQADKKKSASPGGIPRRNSTPIKPINPNSVTTVSINHSSEETEPKCDHATTYDNKESQHTNTDYPHLYQSTDHEYEIDLRESQDEYEELIL